MTSVPCDQAFTHSALGSTFFLSFHFAIDIPVEVSLVLQVPCQIELQVGFGFSELIPEDSLPLFLLGDMTLLPPLVCFLFIVEFCQTFLSHLCRPVSFASLPACENTFERGSDP